MSASLKGAVAALALSLALICSAAAQEARGSFQALDDTVVYVLGSDGKLWREFGTYDNSSWPRVMVDANVRGFQAIDDTLVYVLGSDGKLWREFGTYDNSSRRRVMVDANVQGFQAIDDRRDRFAP
jgi:hypothetical protein